MNFNTVDLEKKLNQIKSREKRKTILQEVQEIWQESAARESKIAENLENSNSNHEAEETLLDQNQIYTLEQIKAICIKYRLRFLDSSVFKGEIPYEAISKIKVLEDKLGISIENFKIVAPKELFKLEDKDSDPLLFLPLKNGKYYLIHKWGGEINFFRSLLAFPLRDFMTMFWFLLGVAIVFSLIIPTPSWDVFAFLVVHSFIAICGLSCMLVMGFRENFSSTEWDSKYLS